MEYKRLPVDTDISLAAVCDAACLLPISSEYELLTGHQGWLMAHHVAQQFPKGMIKVVLREDYKGDLDFGGYSWGLRVGNKVVWTKAI